MNVQLISIFNIMLTGVALQSLIRVSNKLEHEKVEILKDDLIAKHSFYTIVFWAFFIISLSYYIVHPIEYYFKVTTFGLKIAYHIMVYFVIMYFGAMLNHIAHKIFYND